MSDTIPSTEFNELLQALSGDYPLGDLAQIWVIGTRDQVLHIINEFYVRKMVTERSQFSPMIPAPFARGKYMTLLMR